MTVLTKTILVVGVICSLNLLASPDSELATPGITILKDASKQVIGSSVNYGSTTTFRDAQGRPILTTTPALDGVVDSTQMGKTQPTVLRMSKFANGAIYRTPEGRTLITPALKPALKSDPNSQRMSNPLFRFNTPRSHNGSGNNLRLR